MFLEFTLFWDVSADALSIEPFIGGKHIDIIEVPGTYSFYMYCTCLISLYLYNVWEQYSI